MTDGYRIFRRALFALDAERAHGIAIGSLRVLARTPPLGRWWRRRYAATDPRLATELCGRPLASPVGLAAGFDKNAEVIDGAAALGFGFTEVGTVTPRPQPGNPKPRMFRHPDAESLQNALGFNNCGMAAMQVELDRPRFTRIPVGVNIGKNRDTPLERADADYLELVRGLADRCDYFVVNLSSPNTPGLRDLQSREWIERLLAECRLTTDRPLFVKLSPDLAVDSAIELSAGAVGAGAVGVILANTTIDYSLLPGATQVGGLSGRVLRRKSFDLLRAVAPELPRESTLISVGGVDSGAEVYRRLRAGARFVQLYSALVFHGPGLIRRIHRELLELMERDGVERLDDLIGVDL